jgi:hypothetical protein
MRSYRRRSQATRAGALAAPRAAIRGSAIRIAPAAARTAFSRPALLGSVWLGALAMLAPNTAHAVDGTWTGITSAEWNVGTNWNSTPTPNTVPDDIATFDTSTRTSVTISGPPHVDWHDSVHRRGAGVFLRHQFHTGLRNHWRRYCQQFRVRADFHQQRRDDV